MDSDVILVNVILGGITLLLAGTLYWFLTIMLRITFRTNELQTVLLEQSAARIRSATIATNPEEQKQRDVILATDLKSFYYLDEDQVRSLYSQLADDVELTAIETRRGRGGSKGIGLNWARIAAKLDRSESDAIISKYEANLNPEKMYNLLQRHLADKHMITFGIETFYFDESKRVALRDIAQTLKDDFSYVLPEEEEESVLQRMRMRAAVDHLQQLVEIHGYVAVHGTFFNEETDQDKAHFRMEHPANGYIPEDSRAALTRAYIDVTCDPAGLTTLGQAHIRPRKRIKLTAVGVAQWDDVRTAVVISPIALYQ